MGVRGYEATADGSDFDEAWTEDIAKSQGRIANVGLYPMVGASYIVFKVSSTYYRRDGTTGIVDDSNVDASTLLQGAINDIDTAGGGTLFLRSAVYEIATGLDKHTSALRIIGEAAGGTAASLSGVLLKATGVIPYVLRLGDASSEARDIVIKNIHIDGNSNATYGLDVKGWNDGLIEKVMVQGCLSHGFYFEGAGGYPDSNIDVYMCRSAFNVGSGFATTFVSEYITFRKCLSYVNAGNGYAFLSSGPIHAIDSISVGDGTTAGVGFYVSSYNPCTLIKPEVYGGAVPVTAKGIEAHIQNLTTARLTILGGYIENCVGDGVEIRSYGVTNTMLASIHGLTCRGNGGYGVNRINNDSSLRVFGGDMTGNTSGAFNNLRAADVVRAVIGYTNANAGTGSILNTTTTDVIAHGCDYTPALADITITLGENPDNTPGAIWVDTIGAANFTVNCENDPGASNLDFSWAVRKV